MEAKLTVSNGDHQVILTPTVIEYAEGEHAAGGAGTVTQEGTATVLTRDGQPVDEETARAVLERTLSKETVEKTFKGRISEKEAILAYQRIHAYAAEKREINKLQKEDKEIVDEFLKNNPDGFFVHLRDARDNSHEYHIKHEEKSRLSLVKDVLAHKIGCAVNELKPSLLAEAVEQGVISISDIRAHEELSEHTVIKKTKIKKPRKKKGEV